MEIELVVRIQFADYKVGERITDTAKIAELKDSPFVVRVAKRQQRGKPPAA